MKRILIMMLLVLFLAGCQGGQDQSSPTGESVEDPMGNMGDESVVAEVNGEKIYQSEVDQVKQRAQQQGQQVQDGRVVEQLVQQKLLLQEAENRGITATTEETEEFLKENLGEQMSLEDVKSQVGDQYSELIEQQKQQVVLQKLIEDEQGNMSVTEEEVREFYENNKQMMGNTTFEEAEEQLTSMVEQQKQQQVVQTLVEDLRQEGEVDIKVDTQPQQQMPEGQQIQME